MNQNKYIFSISFFLLSILLLCNGCLNDPKTTNTANPVDSTTVALPPPPPDSKIEAIVKQQEEKSDFLNKGCCGDKEKRKKESCCCDLVLEEYKILKSQKKANLSKLYKMKTDDPIFSDCFKKLKKQFEKIDTEIDEAEKKANPKVAKEIDY